MREHQDARILARGRLLEKYQTIWRAAAVRGYSGNWLARRLAGQVAIPADLAAWLSEETGVSADLLCGAEGDDGGSVVAPTSELNGGAE